MPEEFEIILTSEGTQVVKVCLACLGGKTDTSCVTSPALPFVKALMEEDHVSEVFEPMVDPVALL